MHPSVKKALDLIVIEQPTGQYNDTFDAVHEVVIAYGESNLANRLFSDIPRAIPPQLIAELFNLLAWQTDDNGAAMTREVEQWLREGQDTRKLTIALGLEVFPFPDAHEMYRVLSSLALTAPEVATRCQELITLRKAREQG